MRKAFDYTVTLYNYVILDIDKIVDFILEILYDLNKEINIDEAKDIYFGYYAYILSEADGFYEIDYINDDDEFAEKVWNCIELTLKYRGYDY